MKNSLNSKWLPRRLPFSGGKKNLIKLTKNVSITMVKGIVLVSFLGATNKCLKTAPFIESIKLKYQKAMTCQHEFIKKALTEH